MPAPKNTLESYLDERGRWGVTRRNWLAVIAIGLWFAWALACIAAFALAPRFGYLTPPRAADSSCAR